MLGALLAIWLRGQAQDIYFQIGLLTLVGLAAKNAILIVEFCVVLRREGKGIVESSIEAARLRFRPIVMTSLAFILGVAPLAVSTGAGAAAGSPCHAKLTDSQITRCAPPPFLLCVFLCVSAPLRLHSARHRHVDQRATSAKSTTTERPSTAYVPAGTAGASCHGTMSCGDARAVSIQRRHCRGRPRSVPGSSNRNGSQ